MQSSNLVFCNGESACFVVALSGYRRRWVEGEGEWWEEIVRQLPCLLLHLGRGKQGWRMNEWMNVHCRGIKTTGCLSSVHTFFFCVVPLWPQVVLQSQTLFFLFYLAATLPPNTNPLFSTISVAMETAILFFSHVGMTQLKQISWRLLMCMTDSVIQLTDLYFHFWQKTWKEHTDDS